MKIKCLFIVLACILANWGCLSNRQPLTITHRDTVTTVRIDTVFFRPADTEETKFSWADKLTDTLKFDFETHQTTVEIDRSQPETGKEKVTVKNRYIEVPIYHECTDTIFVEKTTVIPGIDQSGRFPFEAVALALIALFVWWTGRSKEDPTTSK